MIAYALTVAGDVFGDAPCSVIELRHDHDVALTLLGDKQSPVRRFMDRELPIAAPVCKEANASVRADERETLPSLPFQSSDDRFR